MINKCFSYVESRLDIVGNGTNHSEINKHPKKQLQQQKKKTKQLFMKYSIAFCFLISVLLPSIYGLLWVPIGPAANPIPASATTIQLLQNRVDQMKARWELLDAQCDPNAVFALMYLYMTKKGLDSVQSSYFENGDVMAHLIQTFAQRYTNAINSWLSGNRNINSDLTQVWFDAFTYTTSNYSSVNENLIQQMNVHINYDLAIAVYHSGHPVSLKADFDRVNDLLAASLSTIRSALAQRYEPNGNVGTGSTLLDDAAVDAVIGWRSNSWTQGQLLQSLATDALRAPVYVILQTDTTTISTTQMSYNSGQGETAPARIAYCQANHFPLPF